MERGMDQREREDADRKRNGSEREDEDGKRTGPEREDVDGKRNGTEREMMWLERGMETNASSYINQTTMTVVNIFHQPKTKKKTFSKILSAFNRLRFVPSSTGLRLTVGRFPPLAICQTPIIALAESPVPLSPRYFGNSST